MEITMDLHGDWISMESPKTSINKYNNVKHTVGDVGGLLEEAFIERLPKLRLFLCDSYEHRG